MPYASASFTKSGAADLDFGVVLGVEEILPLADHAEIAVVDDRDLDVEVLLHAVASSLRRHLEAAVADDRPDFESGRPILAPIADGRP